ncbi:restriction endonuclease subunit S [Sphingobacterium faecium]|uniref:restriction endonuclease subunit S n=1 Tax=Sphingobacterium faecium TaxID=34087 RepID=UPI003209CBAC
MNSFVKNKIEDVCEFIGGSQPPKSQFSDIELPNYIRLVQTRDFKTDAFITYIPKNSTSKFFGKSDIMIGRYGPPIFQIFRGKEGAYNVALLKAKPKKNILNDYLYYFLKQDSVFRYIDKLSARTGGQTGIDLVSLNKYPINLPDLFIQQKIAAVLSALDDKIELNTKINAELEAMAKTLYDYWFVQFDFPNEEGKPYKSSDGKMVYNEILKRDIPEGWEVKSLYSIAKFLNGLACQKYRPEKDEDDFLPVIKIREMGEGISANTERVRLDIPEKNTIDDGDVLFSWSATLDIKIWSGGKGALNQHIFKVVSDVYPKSFYYFEILNYLKHFKMMAELRKTTMGHITVDHLKTSFISVPPCGLIKRIDEKITPLLRKLLLNEKQNQELAQLRDWLLPMLMNGQVKVVDQYEEGKEIMDIAAETNLEYEKQEPLTFNQTAQDDQRFEMWLSNQGLAARGDIDGRTLKEIFDVMDDEDK